MRIITGKHKSRVLKTLKGPNTRPMMDRMKESIFNTIDSYIEGANVLDLFGGSGALSLEAILGVLNILQLLRLILTLIK